MNEEEKEAVEFVKKRTKELKKYAKRENELVYDNIVLNLLEKLQKENEEKTILLFAGAEKVKKLEKEKEELKEKNLIQEAMIKDSMSKGTIKKFFIEKKKIKDKIEELRAEYEYLDEENKRVNKFEIELLQELIEGE